MKLRQEGYKYVIKLRHLPIKIPEYIFKRICRYIGEPVICNGGVIIGISQEELKVIETEHFKEWSGDWITLVPELRLISGETLKYRSPRRLQELIKSKYNSAILLYTTLPEVGELNIELELPELPLCEELKTLINYKWKVK